MGLVLSGLCVREPVGCKIAVNMRRHVMVKTPILNLNTSPLGQQLGRNNTQGDEISAS
jgi:hypothetical protein